jgi:hypothetical protein
MDVALSLSYTPRTGITNALLLRLSWEQTLFVKHQIEQLQSVAAHPALLPTLIYSNQRSLIRRLIDEEVDTLFHVEVEAERDVVEFFNSRGPVPKSNVDDMTAQRALTIIQFTTAWERYTKMLLCGLDSVKSFIKEIDNLVGEDDMRFRGEIITERLSFLSQKATMMQYMAEFVKERASAQVSAVSVPVMDRLPLRSQLTLRLGLRLHFTPG